MKNRWLNLLCLAHAPALVLSLYVTWWTARLSLGYWPRASFDDPKDIAGIGVPYHLTGVLLVLLPAAVLIPLGLAAWSLAARRDRDAAAKGVYAFATITLAVLAVAFLRWDPYGVGDWYMD